VWKCPDCPKAYKSDRGWRHHKSLHKKLLSNSDSNIIVEETEGVIVMEEEYPDLEVGVGGLESNSLSEVKS